MTTKEDNITKRIQILGEGQEDTVGVPRIGFEDASGEYPKQDYYFGTSINKGAKGETSTDLFTGGGDVGVSIELPDQKPSQYPYNQAQQTASGHAWEIDDTPGGERVIIKHRTGSGVELRADGSVVFSAVNKKVEVTGGDHTVIVEGQGNLVYKGDLNVRVTGDYNLQVDGNINFTAAGNKEDVIHGNYTTTVDKNHNETIKGAKATRVVQGQTSTILGDHSLFVKGLQRNWVEGDVELTSGGTLVTTAIEAWAASSQKTNITGLTVSVLGVNGTIGGTFVDHYGKAYSGPPDGAGNGGTTFYGTLVGKAAEAITADFANKAGQTPFAKYAQTAGTAPDGPAKKKDPEKYKTIFDFCEVPPTAPEPTTDLITPHLSLSNFAIRNIQVDTDIDDPDSLVAKILKTDDYQELFDRDPSIEEIRSKLRDEANHGNGEFTSKLIANGLLSSEFALASKGEIGRTSNRKKQKKFGTKPLGNVPADNKSKRFLV